MSIRPTPRTVASALAIDIALVVVFAAIGRVSHTERLTVVGVGETAWPFLTGLIAGWLATLGWRAPLAPVRTGLGVWALTLAGGMLLRAASRQGVAVAFVVVAGVVLLLFLVGWRGVATAIRRRRAVSEPASGSR